MLQANVDWIRGRWRIERCQRFCQGIQETTHRVNEVILSSVDEENRIENTKYLVVCFPNTSVNLGPRLSNKNQFFFSVFWKVRLYSLIVVYFKSDTCWATAPNIVIPSLLFRFQTSGQIYIFCCSCYRTTCYQRIFASVSPFWERTRFYDFLLL